MKSHFAWSVRRELWESRSIYVVPLAVAGLVLVAFFFHLGRMAESFAGLEKMQPSKQALLVTMPYSLAASVILLTSFIVGAFYAVDALNSERRDRSILFWKSMPVSDMTTVLSKAFVPFALLPAIAFVIALATQIVLLGVTTVVLSAKGIDTGLVWSRLPLFQMTGVMLYGIFVHALWYAPIYALLLLVSLLAKRAPFLWAVMPVVVLQVLEKIAFGTQYVGNLVSYRLLGAMKEAFVPNAMKEPITSLAALDPGRFFSSPGLWLGLLFAAMFLALAIRLRRYREPI